MNETIDNKKLDEVTGGSGGSHRFFRIHCDACGHIVGDFDDLDEAERAFIPARSGGCSKCDSPSGITMSSIIERR